jgi:hypothetical protein
MDATLQPNGPGVLPLGVERKDATVNVASLVPDLTTVLAKIGRVHLDLFDKPLVITSANDGKHGADSKHYANKAVDVCMADKTKREQEIFFDILVYFESRLHLLAVGADEETCIYHLHVETAD